MILQPNHTQPSCEILCEGMLLDLHIHFPLASCIKTGNGLSHGGSSLKCDKCPTRDEQRKPALSFFFFTSFQVILQSLGGGNISPIITCANQMEQTGGQSLANLLWF